MGLRNMSKSMFWVARHLQLKFSEPTSQPRFNPRPPGVIRPGSSTDAVLAFLTQHPDRLFTCFELCKHTGFSIKAVNHACQYLQGRKKITHCEDPRNPRYYRYRLAKEKPHADR